MESIMKKIIAVLLLISLNGCAVAMAINGREAPNMEAVRKGAGESTVNFEMGTPVDMRNLPNGNIVQTYQYDMANKPSPGRAVLHGVMDLVTFGLWEFLGTPLELTKGKIYQTEVEFDGNLKVVKILSTKKIDKKDFGIFPQIKAPD